MDGNGALAPERFVDRRLDVAHSFVGQKVDEVLADRGAMDGEQPASRAVDRHDVIPPIHDQDADRQPQQQTLGFLPWRRAAGQLAGGPGCRLGFRASNDRPHRLDRCRVPDPRGRNEHGDTCSPIDFESRVLEDEVLGQR